MSTLADVKKNTEQRMHKSLDALKADCPKSAPAVRTRGCSTISRWITTAARMPIPKVANVSLLDARTLGVSPWEKKMLGVIEKAIRESDLGLNPASHGDMVRVPMPILTEERRRDLIKVIKHEGENAKVAVRNLRRDANHALKELLKARLCPKMRNGARKTRSKSSPTNTSQISTR